MSRAAPWLPAQEPTPPLPAAAPAAVGDTHAYGISSPSKQGVVMSWGTAGHHALPSRESKVKLVGKPPWTFHTPYQYHTIVKGRYPGVYKGHWYNFEDLVKHVPGANHKGFHTLADAKVAYIIAYALGFVQATPARGFTDIGPPPTIQSMVSTTPSQEDIAAALSQTDSHSVGTTWYTVMKGVRPGVYPCWNVVAEFVTGISTATFRAFLSRADAEAAFEAAQQAREVHQLCADILYIQ
ncbi:hypothetical protein HWV62_33950 [Athelia sp. TMB]|nr:hypothetical protein HWV62_33950 [Athelia sp. TMB]